MDLGLQLVTHPADSGLASVHSHVTQVTQLHKINQSFSFFLFLPFHFPLSSCSFSSFSLSVSLENPD